MNWTIHNATRPGRRRAVWLAALAAALVGCALPVRAVSSSGNRGSPQASITPAQGHAPESFLSITNYSPDQTVYAGDLNRFGTKWWSGGAQLSSASQRAMLQSGYHFLPSFNTGYMMRTQGFTDVPASIPKQAEGHSCIDRVCQLNSGAILAYVHRVQQILGGEGNYYDVGNEVDDYYSDDVSPAVFGGQFDAWTTAIKHGDRTAKIVAPSISSVSCCWTPATHPFGTAGEWFRAFVTDYKRTHKGTRPPIDILSMHLYNDDPTTAVPAAAQVDNYLAEVRRFRKEADSLGYAGTPIWVTEMGFALQGTTELTSAQSRQVTRVLSALIQNASALLLQRLFLFTDNQPMVLNLGLRPLYSARALSSPSHPMPLTDYGQLVAGLAGNATPRPPRRGSPSGPSTGGVAPCVRC